MRICNWCVLFLALFGGMTVFADLEYRYAAQAQYTMTEYNRIFDRAAEDALNGGVLEEYADGSVRMDGEKVAERFAEQTAFVLDLTTEAERERLRQRMAFQCVVNEADGLSAEKSGEIQSELEEKLAAHTSLQGKKYLLLLASSDGEEWVQNLKNRAFYSFLELPDSCDYPWSALLGDGVRYAFSGAELVKRE